MSGKPRRPLARRLSLAQWADLREAIRAWRVARRMADLPMLDEATIARRIGGQQ
jgi:hypothetical protein